MKLTAVFLFAACLSVAARTEGQVITLSVKNKPLEKVLIEIKKQSGFSFIYGKELIGKADPVSINVKDEPLARVLDLIFQNQTLTYKISDNYVVISPKTAAFQPAGNSPKENAIPESIPLMDIAGRVTDEDGNGLLGASVKVKGTDIGTRTDASGFFKLEGIAEDAILEISYVGFENRSIKAASFKAIGNKLALKRNDSPLDVVQIIGYGTTTSRLNTGSVSRITGTEISKQPVTNVLQALVGRFAGLSISQSNGLPGGDVSFVIRGRNSLYGANSAYGAADQTLSAPLVVIDGVPYPSIPINHQNVSGGSPIISLAGYGNPLYNINPNDIESLEILKDADATAIYGSRAGNGVMLITTKKGKQGKTKVDINASYGIALDTRRVPMLTTPEYIALRREAFSNSGLTPSLTPGAAFAPDLLRWDSTKNTNWQNELLGNRANITDVNVSLSGGAGGTSFLVSGFYHHENTIYADRPVSQKGGAHFSFNHTSVSGRFNISLSGFASFATNKLSALSYPYLPFKTPPNYDNFNSSGNLNWDWTDNLKALMIRSSFNKGFTLTSNLLLRYTVLPGLEAKASVGYTRLETEQQTLNPKASFDPRIPFQAQNLFSLSRNQTLNVEPQLQYTVAVAGGNLNILTGATVMKVIGEMPTRVIAIGFTSDAYINNPALAGTTLASTGYSAYQYASFFGRANYNWQNRYILNSSFRRDGSSRFGPDHRFGNFGAIGASWLFSNEAFFKKNAVLSFGKLRGSVGWVGSDNIDNYAFLSTYSATTYGYNSQSGLVPSGLANSNFGWEATRKLEAALELGFVNDRILLSVARFQNRTSNQLVGYPVSTQTGFASFTANLNTAIVQNTGWEIVLNTTNIRSKHLKWATSFNMTIPQNKLLKFDGIEKTSYANTLVVGKPINSYYAVHFTGVDAAGKPQYEDVNKNGVINYYDLAANNNRGDKIYVGKGDAGYYGGMTNTVSYKNFQLDFTLQYTGGLQKPGYLASVGNPGGFYNVPRKAVEDIRARGLANSFFRTFSLDYFYYANYSDALYTDASFIRLTNAALSYNFSEKWLKPLHMAGLNAYVQAQNLFVISGYDGFDPESGATVVPPLFRIMAGIKCSF